MTDGAPDFQRVSAINLDAPGVPHPRNSSTNVRVLGHYVRDEHVLTLEDAVRKMTSLPAQILGLRDGGQIREGFAGALVIDRGEHSGARPAARSGMPRASAAMR